MLSPDLKKAVFKSIPPKEATKFKYDDNIYSAYKGYTHLTNVEEVMKTHHVAILFEYVTERRSESETPKNYKFETFETEDGIATKWGEVLEGILGIKICCKKLPDIPLDEIMDRFINRIVEWYICELNDIVHISSRTEISPLKTFQNDIFYRELQFGIKYTRKFTRVYGLIHSVQISPIEIITVGGLTTHSDEIVFILDSDEEES